MCKNKLSPPEKWILLGIPVLFIVGSMFHFLFGLSGKLPVIGAIAPVNESVWEHEKMLVVPIILWWLVIYLLKGKEYNISENKWFTGMIISLVSSLFTIPVVFYFYTQVFGIELIIIDILLLLFAITVGQLLSLHFYRYSDGINSVIAIGIALLILAVFIFFTFYPPHLPIFYDTSEGGYGIIK